MLKVLPDLSLFPNIEQVILRGCTSLLEVYSSSFLDKLNYLYLDGCLKLETLDICSNILSRSSGLVALHRCQNLKTLIINSGIDVVQSDSCPLYLNGCLELEELPEIKETMENLKVLALNGTSIKELPSSLHLLVGLEELNLQGCTKLKTIPSSIGNLSKLLKLNLIFCESLETFPSSIFKLKLTELNFKGCSMLATFPDILEPAKSFTYINLTNTTIKELPSSLHHLVGLEELNLQGCTKLKTIPSSIGNLSKLLKLKLAFCESLETFPSSIFKLKLTELNFDGCSMLGTFPEILEPAESFTHINLTNTAIKELPASLHLLVGLKELNLRGCKKLKTIPSSIGNLNKLFMLDLAYCASLETIPSSIFKLKLKSLNLSECKFLECVPNNIVRLSSLTELSLQGSSIVNLPESVAHLSSLKSLNLSECKFLECVPNNIGRLSSLTGLSLKGSSIVNLPESLAHLSCLKSLDLSDCKLLECVPKLPPNLNQVLAYHCPSIKRIMLNSKSDSEDLTFKFHLTNSQKLDAASWSNIGDEACIKITDGAYRSVVFCFPGSAVPRWFHYSCKGLLVTMKKVSPNVCSKNRLIGFALCAVLGPEDMDEAFIYKFEFISDGEIYSSYHCLPENYLNWNCPDRFIKQDHTFLWKHQLYLEEIGNKRFHAQNFTFEFLSKVKECGICPLYTKEI